MSDLGGGVERVLTFDLPLPLTVVWVLGEAITAALEAQGWSDVLYVMDGAYVTARRPRPE